MFNASEGRPASRSPGRGGGRAQSAGWCGGWGENSLKLSRPWEQGPFSPAAYHYPAPTSLSSVAQSFGSLALPKEGTQIIRVQSCRLRPLERGTSTAAASPLAPRKASSEVCAPPPHPRLHRHPRDLILGLLFDVSHLQYGQTNQQNRQME